MTTVTVTLFTDPACPIALSAEPRRMALAWHYRDTLAWDLCPIVLNDAPREFDPEGFSKEMFTGYAEHLVAAHGMPIDLDALRRFERLPSSLEACRAIVAADVHGAESDAWRLLQALREQHWTRGVALDASTNVADAARAAGIDADDLATWSTSPETTDALHASMEAARTPLPSARVLDHRLSDASDGRRRYGAPSWELRVEGHDPVVVPGFMERDAYDVAIAHLAPDATRHPAAENVREVLEWADRPLAVAEVAAIRDIEVDEARAELAEIGVTGAWVQLERAAH